MRTIKFRVWTGIVIVGEKHIKPMLHFNLKDRPYHFCEGDVMQYIGLKDKNGREIYEGDIVQKTSAYKNRYGRGVVAYEGHSFVVNGEYDFTHYDEPWDFFSEEIERVEVIGNIYENPDLLTKH